jgi:hypothetical protein
MAWVTETDFERIAPNPMPGKTSIGLLVLCVKTIGNSVVKIRVAGGVVLEVVKPNLGTTNPRATPLNTPHNCGG